MLKDTSIAHNRINVAKFKTEIEKHRLWKYVEIKAFLFRTLDDGEWKIQFLYILLQKDKPDSIQALNTNHLRLLHRVHEIHELDTLLNQITEEKRINLGDISASLDLIPSNIKYFHKPNNTFGIVDDSYYLLKSGDSSEQLRKVETLLISEVEGHDNLKDLIRNSLQLDFWDGYYGPFLGVFAPIPLRAL